MRDRESTPDLIPMNSLKKNENVLIKNLLKI